MTTVLEVHPSDVNAALLCPARLIEDTDRQPSYDMMRGSVVHHMISSTLLSEEVSPFESMNHVLDEYDYDLDTFPYPQAASRLMLEALTAYEHWHADILPVLSISTMQVEMERKDMIWMDEELDIEVDLVGTPDLVDAEIVIHDWKTARRMWEVNKPPGQMQPPLYSHLVDKRPRPFVFWIFDYSANEWKPMHPIVPTQTQIDAALDMAWKIAMAKHRGLLIANPGQPPAYASQTRSWWCSTKYCHRWNNCLPRRLVNDGNDDNVADWRTEWKEANG